MTGKSRLLAEFCNIADARMSADYHDGFFSLEELFGELIFETDLLADVAKTELAAIAADPNYSSATWEPHNIVIASGLYWQLRVGFYTRSADFIYSLPFHMMVAVSGMKSLIVNQYVLPGGVDKAIFDPHLQLAEPVRHVHVPGAVTVIDSRRDVVDAIIDGPVLAIKFSSTIHEPLQWAFSRETRQASQAIAADPVDSDLVTMAQALGAMERAAATPALIDLARHPRHFVRWAALQALARVAPECALIQLREAVNDVHPHVRAAASRALTQLA